MENDLNNANLFTCTVEPRWSKPTFTMRIKVESAGVALKEALKYKQLSGGFNHYSNFRYEGRPIKTKGLVLLKTGEIVKGFLDERGNLIK